MSKNRYNYEVIKQMDNKKGIVSLEKIDGKRPKYVD
jgi:hypothetical protein